IKYILENTDEVRRSIKERHVNCDLDLLLAGYKKLKEKKIEIEELRAEANKNAEAMKSAKSYEEKQPFIEKGRELKDKIHTASVGLDVAEAAFKTQMMTV